MEEEVEMGPLVSQGQRESVAGFVDRAQDAGAKVLTGGEKIEGPGAYYKPTVVTDVAQDAEIIQQEVFGPVVTVQRFSDEDEAVRWANDVVYGLAAPGGAGEPGPAVPGARRPQVGAGGGSTRGVRGKRRRDARRAHPPPGRWARQSTNGPRRGRARRRVR